MKEAWEIKPNYAPVYAAALYPELAKIFIANGYALAVHGSCARDFDLIAVPWGEKVTGVEEMLKIVTDKFAIRVIGEADQRRHGRIAYTISVGFGECAVDLSFLPVVEVSNEQR